MRLFLALIRSFRLRREPREVTFAINSIIGSRKIQQLHIQMEIGKETALQFSHQFYQFTSSTDSPTDSSVLSTDKLITHSILKIRGPFNRFRYARPLETTRHNQLWRNSCESFKVWSIGVPFVNYTVRSQCKKLSTDCGKIDNDAPLQAAADLKRQCIK